MCIYNRKFLLIVLLCLPVYSAFGGVAYDISQLSATISTTNSIENAIDKYDTAVNTVLSDPYFKDVSDEIKNSYLITAGKNMEEALKTTLTNQNSNSNNGTSNQPQTNSNNSNDEKNGSKDNRTDEEKAEAEQEYKDAKEKEQSKENRMLTAGTLAATGIGGMQLAQGLSEQKADKEAEQNMEAYIATMRCKYADKSVKAGPDEIELPGGNDANMMKLRAEYIALAADLKERKTALGMKPGIESEEILDKAQMGLYDDESVGITDGSYASLYRAKMLNSENDQSKLDAAAKEAKTRVIAGGVVAGAGVVGGMLGDSLINGKLGELIKERKANKNAAKEEQEALEDLQTCLKSGGAKHVNALSFDEFTPSVLHLENINCDGTEWENVVKNKTASNLFIDSIDEDRIITKLKLTFGPDIASELLNMDLSEKKSDADGLPQYYSTCNEFIYNRLCDEEKLSTAVYFMDETDASGTIVHKDEISYKTACQKLTELYGPHGKCN